MATISSKHIIENLIESNGYCEGDPRVALIVEYENGWGHTTWGVTWITEPIERQRRYLISSEYVNNPRVIWKAE